MDLLLSYKLYLFFAISAVLILPTITYKTTEFALFHQKSERTTTMAITTKKYVDEKDIKHFLKKMLKSVRITTTIAPIKGYTNPEKENDTISIGDHKSPKNNPVRYTGTNRIINGLCPYFVAGGGFNIEKLEAVYWPRFYNMKNTLTCFKISVVKLTEEEMKDNEVTFGSFNGNVNWKQCHFEIRPRKQTNTRHFLLGDVNDMGVMRNILVTTNENGEVSLEEESPDQWLMVKNLVLLRDCITGEVVVFTTSPLTTTAVDVRHVLLEMGEDITGRMLCDKDDVRAVQESV